MEKSVKALLPSPDLEDIQKSWPLSDYEYQSLKDDIKARGIRHPVLIYEDGGQLYILAGFHRHKIAQEIGLDTVPVEYYAGADTRDARRQYAILENMARRQVTTETKKRLAKIYLEGNPRASDRSIGKITGLDNKTIAQVRADMVRREEIPHVVKRADTRGRQQPATKPKQKPIKTASPKEKEKADINEWALTVCNRLVDCYVKLLEIYKFRENLTDDNLESLDDIIDKLYKLKGKPSKYLPSTLHR